MGILSGVRIVEIEGLGPGPFCAMLLADLGADVVTIARASNLNAGNANITRRGKRIVTADIKQEAGRAHCLDIISHADGLIEGMRPGVMERLGLGPEICHATNPKLVYGRLTGWGQDGPLASAAGHDINYIALSGALWYAGQPGQPPFTPPTLVGDIAGGALYLALGMLAAIMKARETGKGDVIDAAIIDGSAHMMNLLLTATATGMMREARGQSALDGAHWYNSFECADGQYISIGPLEPKFYALLLEKIGLSEDPTFTEQFNKEHWPKQTKALTDMFRTKPRQSWCDLLEHTDVCFAPVLKPSEAAAHPHMKSRNIYSAPDDILQTAPAPRFFAPPRPGSAKSSH